MTNQRRLALPTETVILLDRFMGPEGSANGGYSCGMAAKHVGASAEVTLKLPPPLNQPLEVQPLTPVGVALAHDGTTVAEALPAEVAADAPEPVSFDAAVEASREYLGFGHHPFARCFVCGPDREPGDGMRIFPTMMDTGLFVAPWIPDDNLADSAGTVGSEFVWAALDCPTGWATIVEPPLEKIAVLGRLAAALRSAVRAGGRYVVISWPMGSEGRKFYAGSAIYSADGDLCANSRSTWIQIGVSAEDDARSNRSVSDVRR